MTIKLSNTNSLRRLVIALPALAALVGTTPFVPAGQREARSTFSICVPGKVEVAATQRQAGGSPATIRVTTVEPVEVMIERRAALTSRAVPVLRSWLTTPDDSLTFPATDMSIDSTKNARSTVIVNIVPLW